MRLWDIALTANIWSSLKLNFSDLSHLSDKKRERSERDRSEKAILIAWILWTILILFLFRQRSRKQKISKQGIEMTWKRHISPWVIVQLYLMGSRRERERNANGLFFSTAIFHNNASLAFISQTLLPRYCQSSNKYIKYPDDYTMTMALSNKD